MKVLWIHGKESGPFGKKYHALKQEGYDVIAPDFSGIDDVLKRVEMVTPIIKQHAPFIVGSSLGGATAVLAMSRIKTKVPGILLCAPALVYPSMPPIASLSVNGAVAIIHGSRDSVVPISHSREYVALHDGVLVQVNDDHRLSNSTRFITKLMKGMLSLR